MTGVLVRKEEPARISTLGRGGCILGVRTYGRVETQVFAHFVFPRLVYAKKIRLNTRELKL